MDTQGKLHFFLPFRERDKDIQIDLSSFSTRDRVLVSLSENETAFLYLDPSVSETVQIECFCYSIVEGDWEIDTLKNTKNLKKTFYYPEDYNLTLVPGVLYQILDGGEENLGFQPDIYSLTIYRKNDTKKINPLTGNFEIRFSSNFSDQGLKHLSEILEKTLEGLSFNIFHQSKNATPDAFRLVEYFRLSSSEGKQHLLQLKTESIKLYNHLYFHVTSTIVQEQKLGKENYKSIRYHLTKPKEDIHYNLKKEVSYRTSENQQLKQYLFATQFTIKRILLNLYDNLLKLTKEIKKRKQLLLSESLSKGEIKRIEGEIKTNLSQQNYFQNCKNGLEEALLCYQTLLSKSELKNIPLTFSSFPTALFYQNPSYRYFLHIYSLFLGQKKEETHHARKKTTTLFELYGYALLSKILLDCGYSRRGTPPTLFNIKEGSRFLFDKGNKIAVLSYGPMVRNYMEQEVEDEMVSINSKHNTPDYILQIVDEEGKFITSIVLEMKYRNLDKILQTKKHRLEGLEDNFNDYIQLAYKEEKQIIRGAVSRLYVLYPATKESHQLYGLSMLCGIDLTLEEERSKTYRYLVSEIKKQIQESESRN